MKNLLLILFVAAVAHITFGQNNGGELRQKVLEFAISDTTFIFGKWTEDGKGEETHIKYLGEFTNAKGKTYKVITSSWYWGLSKRATSRIWIYNNKNQYVGNYYVGMVDELPYKLDGSELKFNPTKCGEIKTFNTDFKNGLSKSIYVGCKGENGEGIRGDFYSFNS